MNKIASDDIPLPLNRERNSNCYFIFSVTFLTTKVTIMNVIKRITAPRLFKIIGATPNDRLHIVWNTIQRNRLPCVRIYRTVISKETQIVYIKYPVTTIKSPVFAISYWIVPEIKKRGKCHTDQMSPSTAPDLAALHRHKKYLSKNPRHPSSSPRGPMQANMYTKAIGRNQMGNCAGGTTTPDQRFQFRLSFEQIRTKQSQSRRNCRSNHYEQRCSRCSM